MSTTLRQYQVEAVAEVLSTEVGQVILPTGTGKSTIQAAVIESLIAQNNNFSVYVILTPRILLTNQLMTTVSQHLLMTAGITNLKALTVHSGNTAKTVSDDEEDEVTIALFSGLQNKATTSTEEVKLSVLEAKTQNRPLLICCTYDSVERMLGGLVQAGASITQVLCDEAHYITEKTHNENIVAAKNLSARIHYFTATQKITTSAAGLGMNNVDVFGEVIFRRTPREMIEAGYMVQPRIHSVLAGKETSISKITMDAFIEHDKVVVGEAKMLVCCNGTKVVEEIRKNESLQEWAKENNVAIFSVTSKYGARKDDTLFAKRDEFLAELKAYSGKAIVLHVAILTEGIDVPNMTGVLFVRNMAKCRFLQSLGRATRKLAIDLGKPIDQCVKQFAYAIVIDRVDDGEARDQYASLTNMVKEMREAGYEPKETIYTESDIGTDADDEIDDTNTRDRRIKAEKTANDEVDHELESLDIAMILSSDKSDEEKAMELFGFSN